MCSVGAFISPDTLPQDEKFRELVAETIRNMAYRGTDAAGIAVYYTDGSWWLRKAPMHPYDFAERIREIPWNEKPAKYVLLHTRAATTCSPGRNSCNHPLYYKRGNKLLSLVHNGVLSNMPTLESLPPVDSAALLEKFIETSPKNTLDITMLAFQRISKEIDGSYAIIVSNGDKIGFMRYISPLDYVVLNHENKRILSLISVSNYVVYPAENHGYEVESRGEVEACQAYILRQGSGKLKSKKRMMSCSYSSHLYKTCETC